MLSCDSREVYRTSFLFLQKTAGRMPLIPSNILNVSLALSIINQFSHSLLSASARSRNKCSQQFTVFAMKIFIVYHQKITKVTVTLCGRVTNKGYLEEAVPQRCDSCADFSFIFFKKRSLDRQLHQKKNSCISLFLRFLRNLSFLQNTGKRLEISRCYKRSPVYFHFFEECFFLTHSFS